MTPEQNQRLCRVEGMAPMGQLMRQHWQVICLLEEVNPPDGKPTRARVLGEDLVVFRDSHGSLGVMDEYCPHRRASLAYGRNEDCGLRCLYHGWKMDTEGKVVERPSEPSREGHSKPVHHRAFVAQAWGGFVWAYMGATIAERDAGATIPHFVPPPWAPTADTRVSISKIIAPCNWAQILEGQIDSAHSSHLHSTDMVSAEVDSAKANDTLWFRPSNDKSPRLQIERTEYGFRYAAIRQPITNAQTHDYVRCSVFLAPASALIPPNDQYNVANINTDIDDTHTAFHFIAWGGGRNHTRHRSVAQIFVDRNRTRFRR